MNRSRKAQALVAAAVGATLLGLGGGTVSAATSAQPANSSPPTVTGSAVEGATLTGHRGTWTNNPTDFRTWWQRCDSHGGGCANIAGTSDRVHYLPVRADIGKTLRYAVGAANADGRTWVSSAPTAVVAGAPPANLTPPAISGSPVVGATLSGHRGSWSNSPTDYNTWWQRCDSQGNSCANISGTDGRARYRLTNADVHTTVRYAVGAANAYGRTWAASGPTAAIASAAPPVKNGCPATTSPDEVSAIGPPARLLLDGIQAPSIVTGQTRTLVLRFHVSSTCSGSVRGALVYVSAVPFQQFAIPAEAATGADGWVEVHLQRLAGFPVSSRQQLIALFVRARKAGEDPLAGISTRRLFSVRVNLHA